MDDIPDNILRALLNLYTDLRWHKLWSAEFLYFGTIDGVTVGVIVATSNRPRYEEFALNKREFERLLAALANGKITEAYAVSVIYDNGAKTCVEAAVATTLNARLSGITPRFGKLGEFWTAPSFTGGAEPF